MHKRTWSFAFGTLTFLALAHCGGFSGSGDSPAADAGSDRPDSGSPDSDAPRPDAAPAPPDAAAEPDAGPCTVTPYLGGKVTGGVVCGVGFCRLIASGDRCTKDARGPIETFCESLFPKESFAETGAETDDNCDGRINEGKKVDSPMAGVDCISCGIGHNVKRKADGKVEAAGADRQLAECLNNVLCPVFPSAGWLENPAKVACSAFCEGFGANANCQEKCATASGEQGCSGAGITSNVGSYSKGGGCTTGTCATDGKEFCCCEF